MNKKFRLEEVIIDGYYFLHVPCLLWHSGKFWYNETECRQVENNGSISIKVLNSKFGIIKLRKNAKPCKIKLLKEEIPF